MISFGINLLWKIFKISTNGFWRMRKKQGLEIWFVVPCYHTNMVPMVQAFQEAGDSVNIFVNAIERTENHDHIVPEMIDHILKRIQFGQVLKWPDLLIFRDLSTNARQLVQLCEKQNTRLIHYTQKPSRRAKGYPSLRKDLTRVRAKQLNKLPLGTITPLDRSPFLPIRLFHQTFYFPVNPTPQATKLQANHLRILQVGKLSQPLKRHDWTIRILRELNQPCTLTICGADLDLDYDDGTRSITYYSELMDTPGQTELNGNLSITIFSNLKQNELSKLYAQSDIFVLPSLHEEFGISVLEAMSASCSVIVSQESGSSRHIKQHFNGIKFPANSYEEYRNALEQLIHDAALRKKLQHNARKTILKHHSKEQFRTFILQKA